MLPVFVPLPYSSSLLTPLLASLWLQSILSDRLRINGSLARAAIKELHSKGLIKPVVQHSAQQIFTRATGA